MGERERKERERESEREGLLTCKGVLTQREREREMARLDISDAAIKAAISAVKDHNSTSAWTVIGYVPK